MHAEPRDPSRLPVRGTVAAAGTIGALALLLSFRGGPLAPTEPAMAEGEEPLATDELIGGAKANETTAAEAVEPATYIGDVVETRWGDVEVEVTLVGADITEVVALQLPAGDRHTSDISDYVGPILREEAIASDRAEVSVISGATYTCAAYAASLQSALDQAGRATATVPSSTSTTPEVATGKVAEESAADVADGPTAGGIRRATGEVVPLRWGDVQVAVTVEGEDVLDVETLSIPLDDRRSQLINENAEAILRAEAITSDSADVSVVSGATYTSEAYATSLQSALDQLGL